MCSDELAEYDHPYRGMFMFLDSSEKIEVYHQIGKTKDVTMVYNKTPQRE